MYICYCIIGIRGYSVLVQRVSLHLILVHLRSLIRYVDPMSRHPFTCSLAVIITVFQWPYGEFVDILPNIKTSNEFNIVLKKGKKTNQMTFSCEHRSELMTEALVSHTHF